MDLRFRRNLTLLMLFISIVAGLVLGLGNQPIIAYTMERAEASESGAVNDVDLFDGIDVETSIPADDLSGSVGSSDASGLDVTPAQANQTTSESEVVVGATFAQIDDWTETNN